MFCETERVRDTQPVHSKHRKQSDFLEGGARGFLKGRKEIENYRVQKSHANGKEHEKVGGSVETLGKPGRTRKSRPLEAGMEEEMWLGQSS